MEAVSWITALHIQAEGFSVAVCAALVGVAGNTICIRTNKHGVVIFGILIQKPSLDKARHHISCDAAMFDEIRLRPVPFDITLSVAARLVPRLLPAAGFARPNPAHTPQSAAEHCGSFFPALP